MKPRKVNLSLEITTDLSLGVLRKTRAAVLLYGSQAANGNQIGEVSVQQATATVYQPVPTTTSKKAKKA